MGNLLPTHVLSLGNRQYVVYHGGASGDVQAIETIWLNGRVRLTD